MISVYSERVGPESCSRVPTLMSYCIIKLTLSHCFIFNDLLKNNFKDRTNVRPVTIPCTVQIIRLLNFHMQYLNKKFLGIKVCCAIKFLLFAMARNFRTHLSNFSITNCTCTERSWKPGPKLPLLPKMILVEEGSFFSNPADALQGSRIERPRRLIRG